MPPSLSSLAPLDADPEHGFKFWKVHHQNSYTWSKCLAERLMNKKARAHGVPLTIVRPSIVGPAIATPWKGWIDSKAALTGIYMLFGLGILRTHKVRIMNCVPVDW